MFLIIIIASVRVHFLTDPIICLIGWVKQSTGLVHMTCKAKDNYWLHSYSTGPYSSCHSMLCTDSLHFSVECKRVSQTFSTNSRHLGSSKRHVEVTNQPTVHPHCPHLHNTRGQHGVLQYYNLYLAMQRSTNQLTCIQGGLTSSA